MSNPNLSLSLSVPSNLAGLLDRKNAPLASSSARYSKAQRGKRLGSVTIGRRAGIDEQEVLRPHRAPPLPALGPWDREKPKAGGSVGVVDRGA